MSFRDLAEGEPVEIVDRSGDKILVKNARGNHPQGVFAFRVEHGGKAVVYATDTEHYEGRIDERLAEARAWEPTSYMRFAVHAGGVRRDDRERVSRKKGWGHSTFVEGARLAKTAGVKRLVLFHHDPVQADAAVREKEARARALFSDAIAAYEGLSLDV